MQEKCFLYDRCNHKDCDKELCPRQDHLAKLYTNAGLSLAQAQFKPLLCDVSGPGLKDRTVFEFLKKQVAPNIIEFVQSGQNLFIHSAICGNGKTTCAIKLLQAYFEKIWPSNYQRCYGLFVSVPRFLVAMKENISAKNEYAEFIKSNILVADIVVFDDIGNKVGSEYEITQLLNYVEGRLNIHKANIYTSNLNYEGLKISLGERLASRIANYSTDLELFGSDKRSKAYEKGF